MSAFWSEQDIRKLEQNVDLRVRELMPLFPGRSKVAVHRMHQRVRNGERGRLTKRHQYKPAPPPKEIAQSELLRDRIILAIANYANDNGLGVDDAARRLLSEGVA